MSLTDLMRVCCRTLNADPVIVDGKTWPPKSLWLSSVQFERDENGKSRFWGICVPVDQFESKVKELIERGFDLYDATVWPIEMELEMSRW